MTITTTPSTLLKIPEALALLNVGQSTLYRLFKEGQIRKTKVRGATRISRREIERYLDRNTC